MNKFQNENRSRSYGLRPGDIVTIMYDNDDKYIIKELIPSDNNKVVIGSLSTLEVTTAVAEHCKIIKKVEDEAAI